jgi:hypothetical protein
MAASALPMRDTDRDLSPAMRPQMDEARAQKSAEDLRTSLMKIVGRLETEALDRVNKRTHIEKRWLDDLQQYHGKYDDQTAAKLRAAEQSMLFVNMTRPKTDAMAARLEDLLFPTDDRNWGIQPTPVPSLTQEAEEATEIAEALKEQADAAALQAEGGDPQAMEQARISAEQADAARNAAAQLNGILEEAGHRAKLMQETIDDQLKESRYHAVARDQIESACKIGTGVTKGPTTGDKIRKGWKKKTMPGPDGQPVETEEYDLDTGTGNQPGMRYTDIWNWFPDMDARNVDECDGFYERHLLNRKGLRALAKLPGFSKDAIRRLLEIKPQASAPSYLVSMRNITGQNFDAVSDRYHVWEYTGCLSAEDMRDLAMATGDQGTLDDLQDVDPLDELNAIVWFCQGEVLKFAIYPYDSGEPIYSVFNLVKDDSSIFGYGIPYIMRDAQASLNAAWRMMMDNAALATGPQIFFDTKQVEPIDGEWKLTPRKIWQVKDGVPKDSRIMDQFTPAMHQAELANIIAISQKHIDDETALPQLAQGEQGALTTKTAQGMSILMNSANVVFRRIVKNFDDDVTTPTIRRFYDWNMQFNDKAEIKGDYEVDARGSSVLMVREMQGQNLLTLALQLSTHPVYGAMVKHPDMLRKIFQTYMISPADVMLSDKDYERVAKQAAAAQAEAEGAEGDDGASGEVEMRKLDLLQMEIEAKIEMANMERETKLAIAQMQRDTAMMTMAEKMNMSIDQIEAKMQDAREERERKERQVAVETAVTERAGPSGGGLF